MGSLCRLLICLFAYFTGFVLCTISFLTVTIVSLDRLLTLLLGARYRQRASSKRTCLTVIAVLWILSIVGAFPYFWNPLVTWFCGRIITPICLVTSIFSYTKTFFALRHSQFMLLKTTFLKDNQGKNQHRTFLDTKPQYPALCGYR